MFAMLGRNSLYVFCVGSLLSLAGQIIRFVYRGTIGIDTVVVIFGITIMAFTAWLPNGDERITTRARRQPSAQRPVAALHRLAPARGARRRRRAAAPAPLSKDCQGGATAIADELPLPNVAAALAAAQDHAHPRDRRGARPRRRAHAAATPS